MTEGANVVAQFYNEEGVASGPALSLPVDVNPEQLALLLNSLLGSEEDPLPYTFEVSETEITTTLDQDIIQPGKHSTEETFKILYRPQAVFKVRLVTRCSSSLTGHTDAILCASFSPCGTMLASGGGDTTVRIWDLNTETPRHQLKGGHKHWVQHVSWSPNGKYLASAGMDGLVIIWDPRTGKQDSVLKGHSKWVSALAWEPLHLNASCRRLASSSSDGTVRVWDIAKKQLEFSMAQHTAPVMCVKWAGDGLIYSASRDKTIKVWSSIEPHPGKLVKVLSGHAHWVTTLALSTDGILRTGAFDHTGRTYSDESEAQKRALERYEQATALNPERLCSGSDDFTMYLFSPDGRYIASASFDKSVKLWDSRDGKFIASLRGHVAEVYQVVWSSDSRMLLSCSKDSTIKLWDVKTKKMKMELPGHLDEVFTVDWSPAGDKAASGSKDKTLKIWKH
ncbi:Notchless protein 1 [Modicella reniformis]|uniref:Notchless protein 1 n=1 Tax=Modicella reniformis TaxID=1440133 RepID=A0A9P6J206_9FUNG|nr:Notchless protein 1 [Modicella reniformis]